MSESALPPAFPIEQARKMSGKPSLDSTLLQNYIQCAIVSANRDIQSVTENGYDIDTRSFVELRMSEDDYQLQGDCAAFAQALNTIQAHFTQAGYLVTRRLSSDGLFVYGLVIRW